MGDIAKHPMTGQMIRYGISGAIVTGLYLGLPLALNSGLGWPLQAVIPVAFVLAAALQFTLQRVFVFRHIDKFALSVHGQLVWYVVVGSVQYATTALGTLLLPKLVGISGHVAFLATSGAFSLCFFLFIRGHVFHPSKPLHLQETALVE